MPDWDSNGPELEANLQEALRGVRAHALARVPLTLALARKWHELMMQGLAAPNPSMVANFRGEAGLENCNVTVGRHLCVKASGVRAELQSFERELRAKVVRLDGTVAAGASPTARQIADVIALCAWAHAEWVRIHPFANGNGRTARLWANFLARRYGLPFFVRLRPRPGHGYEAAGGAAMRGDWIPTRIAFTSMLAEHLAES
jgi:Fic family protein